MISRKAIKDAIELMESAGSFFITGHIRPDGDTVGSELAVASWLRKKNKRVDIVHSDKMPENLLFMPGIRDIITLGSTDKKYDAGIIFECPDINRMNNIIRLENLGRIVSIDHHPVYSDFADIKLVDSKVSCCAEIVFRLLNQAKHKLDFEEATCLYVGLLTDTGKFQHRNTTADSFGMAFELVKTGVSPFDVYRKIYCRKTVSSLKMFSAVLGTIKTDGGIAFMKLERAMYRENDASTYDTEDVIAYASTLSGIKALALFAEKEDGSLKVSFRSFDDKVDVNKIAGHFGGGGHRNAAGCEIKGDPASLTEKILLYMKENIK